MCAHALSLSHPGIRCRCLAAYGDAVSAVKWYFFLFLLFAVLLLSFLLFIVSLFVFLHIYINLGMLQCTFFLSRASRLGREHHDDLAQFMLGMGYATEALHLPGISKRYPV